MDSEQQKGQPAPKLTTLQYVLKVLSILVFVITAGGNIAAVFLIISLQKVFRDLFYGTPLPLLTEVILQHDVLFVILAFIWPLLGIGALYLKSRKRRLGTILFSLVEGAILLQCGITFIAVMLAMMGPLDSITNSP